MLLHVNFNPADPGSWIGILWFAWALIWVLAAFTAKRTRREEPAGARLAYLIPVILAALLLFSHSFRTGPLTLRVVPASPPVEWAGVGLTALGIAFTFWARIHLGRNWSGRVVIKQEHELIRTGPYTRVRHPIYTGLLLAIFGTALAMGELRAFLALALAAVHFVRKAKREESFMSQEFGEEYAEYRSRTGMLIPKFR